MRLPNFVIRDVLLNKLFTLGVGGLARYVAVVGSEEQLVEACEFARDERLDIFVLGRGSNVLFSDCGFSGLIIRPWLSAIKYDLEKDELWVGSGVRVNDIVYLAESLGFTGFECFAGLPGTVGGAVCGNAGCYGGQFWDMVEAVKFFNGENFEVLKKESHHYTYRCSVFKEFPERIIVSVQLKIMPKDNKLVSVETKRIRELRQKSQPKQKSAGCIFRNPLVRGERLSAGKLIDEAGLKGTRVGQAEISTVHGNFFINRGGARAGDFIELIQIAKGRVMEKFGVILQEEIIQVGEF